MQVNTVLKEQYSLDWLPEKQLEWYHSEIWCLEKGKKAERALPRLHDALQRFAITFYYLRDFHLYSDIDAAVIMVKRNDIMDGMHNEVLRVRIAVATYFKIERERERSVSRHRLLIECLVFRNKITL